MANSTRTDLVQARTNRPAILTKDGWTVFVAVHDTYYEQTKKAWRQKRANAHPDKGGYADDFRRIETAWRAWREGEAFWYAKHGLLPPDGWISDAERVTKLLEGATEPAKQLSGGGWLSQSISYRKRHQ
jgi:hypothetical protein